MVKLISKKRMNGAAGHVAGKSQEMDDAALDVLAAIQVEAAKHKRTGRFASSFSVQDAKYNSVRDRVIVSDDPNAWSIEYGHLQGKDTGGKRRFVPGLRIVRNAIEGL